MCLLVEYQGHLSWSAVMAVYVKELPILSVELEQLKKRKEELEVTTLLVVLLCTCCTVIGEG